MGYHKIVIADEKKIPLDLDKLKIYGGMIYLEQVMEKVKYKMFKYCTGATVYASGKRGRKNYYLKFNEYGMLIDWCISDFHPYPLV